MPQQNSPQRRTYGPDIATFEGSKFDTAAERLGAGQSRWPDTPVYQKNPGRFFYLKPLAKCFTPDAQNNLTVPATNRGTWGTRNDHWDSAATLQEVLDLIAQAGQAAGRQSKGMLQYGKYDPATGKFRMLRDPGIPSDAVYRIILDPLSTPPTGGGLFSTTFTETF